MLLFKGSNSQNWKLILLFLVFRLRAKETDPVRGAEWGVYQHTVTAVARCDADVTGFKWRTPRVSPSPPAAPQDLVVINSSNKLAKLVIRSSHLSQINQAGGWPFIVVLREHSVLCFQWTGGTGRGNPSTPEFKADDASPVRSCCSRFFDINKEATK